MFQPSFGQDEPLEETEDASLVRTCHLCGKAQCGQRKGRVRCAYCKRIFCLQQLYKKFKIKANVEDKNFKCPRCSGICCCVCNCQRPPPHVHCKVYKVRQNKKRVAPPPDLLNQQPTHDMVPILQHAHIEPSVPQLVSYPVTTIMPIQQEADVNTLTDSVTSPFASYTPDIPGSMHSMFLTC